MHAGLDTSVVLRLVVGEPEQQAAAAWRFIAGRDAPAEGPALISDLVVGESYFALRHHYQVPHAEALRALSALLADERVHPTGSARDVIASAMSVRGGPGLIDRIIHADYTNEQASLYTFDRAAASLDDAHLMEA